MEFRARSWYQQHTFEKAEFEALRAADLYGKVGAARGVENCDGLLGRMGVLDISGAGELR